ncbi:MAG: bifunctional heptose 7-phosphate kinase/heptose 1-phosphate adenyltransferase [Thermoguttaceae bacterium]
MITFLEKFPDLRIAVVGDFFLDRYFLIDPELNEPSVETGLDAYQIVGKRCAPGAAGTVVNNLAALGVGKIYAVGMSGDDGEGFELRNELKKLDVDLSCFFSCGSRFTPTYTKPMMLEKKIPNSAESAGKDGRPSENAEKSTCKNASFGKSIDENNGKFTAKVADASSECINICSESVVERELNRLDIKNRKPLPVDVEVQIENALDKIAQDVDAIMVMDQVSERNCGVITDKIRERIAILGKKNTPRFIYADSRERIGLYSDVIIKCNHYEVVLPFYPEYDRLCGTKKDAEPSDEQIEECGEKTVKKLGKTVFVTLGARGQWVFESGKPVKKIPALLVAGPVDICGAGDATSSGIVAALCAGADFAEAAFFGNVVASITIRQLGTTGTASPQQIIDVFNKVTK